MLVGAVLSALVVGFLAGLLAFKVKSRWCPQCGATTVPGEVPATPAREGLAGRSR